MGRKIKLLKHVFALYSLRIIFSKIFSLATLARLRFMLHLEMQACNMLHQPHLYFYFVGVIISDCQLPKFSENTHKIAQNCTQNFQKLSAGLRGRVAEKWRGEEDVRMGGECHGCWGG